MLRPSRFASSAPQKAKRTWRCSLLGVLQLGHLLGDLQDRRRPAAVVVDARSLDHRVQVRADDDDVLVLALRRIGDHVGGLAVEVDLDLGDDPPVTGPACVAVYRAAPSAKLSPLTGMVGGCADGDGG